MFREIIQDIGKKVPSVENVCLVGRDGIPVSKLRENDQDEVFIVEASTLLNECSRLGLELGAGEVQNFSFSFMKLHVCLCMVNEEYFLLATTSNSSDLGFLKYQLKLKALECFVGVT